MDKPSFKINRITLALLVAVIGTLAVVFFFVSQSWLPRRAWERVCGDLVRRGESLDPIDFMPAPLGVANQGQNFASAEIVRQWMAADEDGMHVPPLLSSWRDVVSRMPESFDESDRQMIEALLGPVESSLANLRSHARLPHASFDFPREINGLLVETHPVHNLASSPLTLLKVIVLDARFQLLRGEAGLTLEDALAMLRFSDLFAREPGMLSFVLRLTCLSLLLMLGKLSGIGNTVLDAGRRLHLIRTATAIESYRLEHGRLPEDLQSVEMIPLDPLDDRPFTYRLREGDGFTLEAHSEGNLSDDPFHFEDLVIIVPMPPESVNQSDPSAGTTRSVVGPTP